MKTEVIIRLLGIQNCVDTVVGNAYLRGVSGGERKRVTSAEMLVGPKVCILCLSVCWLISNSINPHTVSSVPFVSAPLHPCLVVEP